MPVQDDSNLLLALVGKTIAVFNGPDEQFLCNAPMGAKAGIGWYGGVMPGTFLKLN